MTVSKYLLMKLDFISILLLLDYAHDCAWVADLPRLRCPTTPGFDGR